MAAEQNKSKKKVKIKEYEIQLLSPSAILPKKATRGAIGYDLCVPHDIRIPAHSRIAIPLDIAINLPFGIEAKIEPRSGCSLRGIEGYGTKVERTKIFGIFTKKRYKSGRMYYDADVIPGKIDPNYTDNIHVLMVNRDESFLLRAGSRIAQLTFYQTIAPFYRIVDKLSCKTRGGGLGSTGTDRIMKNKKQEPDVFELTEEELVLLREMAGETNTEESEPLEESVNDSELESTDNAENNDEDQQEEDFVALI